MLQSLSHPGGRGSIPRTARAAARRAPAAAPRGGVAVQLTFVKSILRWLDQSFSKTKKPHVCPRAPDQGAHRHPRPSIRPTKSSNQANQ